jgi:hypothetical protein
MLALLLPTTTRGVRIVTAPTTGEPVRCKSCDAPLDFGDKFVDWSALRVNRHHDEFVCLNATIRERNALRADLARVTAERDEVVEACRGTHMDEAAIASMWSYVREKIGIQHERDALRAALAASCDSTTNEISSHTIYNLLVKVADGETPHKWNISGITDALMEHFKK